MKRAPNSLRQRIAEIPGVAAVQTRVVAEVTLDVPGLPEPAIGAHLHPGAADATLNDCYFAAGVHRAADETARCWSMKPSPMRIDCIPAHVKAVINGKRQRLNDRRRRPVAGVCLPDRPGRCFPDNSRFGVFWMGYTDLAAAFDMRGASIDVTLTLRPARPSRRCCGGSTI